jgi:hypothetical protein
MRRNEGAVIFAQSGALRAVVVSERGGERRCVHWDNVRKWKMEIGKWKLENERWKIK